METGEVLDGVPTVVRGQRKHLAEEYLVIFLEALEATARDKDIGAEAYRVLHLLLAKLRMCNEWQVINHGDIAEQLDMKRQNVSRALNLLISKQIIIKGTRIGRGHAYSLNPNYGWRGPAVKQPDAKKKAPHLKLVSSPATPPATAA